ncbi:nucleotidyltransferase family protein [Phaeobacter sp.]|uniref:nucleotidyltransferase family protein n=1 Tax=Phaeobacter sp. TaxID=1902409 RepID=UPI0025E3FAA7|nr:nucleotidyltransferase family protein [Phaeobacter sp.]
MIFAAGFGTRMRHLTADRPKPMIPVCDRPLIDHALSLAQEISPEKIVINTHYKAEVLHAHLDQTDVIICHEDADILDTGGGLRNALGHLGTEPVLTMNPDVVWRGANPLSVLLDHWEPSEMDALLCCVPLTRTIGRSAGGDFQMAEDGRLSRGGDLVYGGVQILKTDRLATVPDQVFSLNRIWDQIAAQKRLYAVEYPGFWCDVGTPEGIPLAEELLSRDDI